MRAAGCRGLAAGRRDVSEPLPLPGEGADHQGGGVGVTGRARGVAPAAVLVLYGLQPAHRVVHDVPVPAHLDERLGGGRGGIGVQHRLRVARHGDIGPVRGVGAVGALLGDQPVHRLRGGRHALDPLGQEGQRLPPDTVVRGVLRAVQPGRQRDGRRGRRGRRRHRDRGSGRTEHGGGGGERCCAAAYGHGGRCLSCGRNRAQARLRTRLRLRIPRRCRPPGFRWCEPVTTADRAFRLTVSYDGSRLRGQCRICTGFPLNGHDDDWHTLPGRGFPGPGWAGEAWQAGQRISS